MTYHPGERMILRNTVVRRYRRLPPGAYGQATVSVGDHVESNTPVLQGEMPQDFRIIDIAGALGMSPDDSEGLRDILAVTEGDPVEKGQRLANPTKRRLQRLVPEAPADGAVMLIDQGRMILEVNPAPVRVQARIQGSISAVENNAVQIESIGSLLQCAWGNGRFTFATQYQMEPEGGLRSLIQRNTLFDSVRRVVFVLPRMLHSEDFEIALQKELGGLIAASMPYNFQEVAKEMPFPVILTDGFGDVQPTREIFTILRSFEVDRQASIDAVTPDRWAAEQPEIILHGGSQQAMYPQINQPLLLNAKVRIQRAPLTGKIGTVTKLFNQPQPMENGLRVAAAQVTFPDKSLAIVPLANLQLLGEAPPDPEPTNNPLDF